VDRPGLTVEAARTDRRCSADARRQEDAGGVRRLGGVDRTALDRHTGIEQPRTLGMGAGEGGDRRSRTSLGGDERTVEPGSAQLRHHDRLLDLPHRQERRVGVGPLVDDRDAGTRCRGDGAGEAPAVRGLVGDDGEAGDAELGGERDGSRGGGAIRRAEPEDDAAVAGEPVRRGTRQDQGHAGRCRDRRGGEGAAAVLRPDHADASRLGDDRSHRFGGARRIAPVVAGDDVDGLTGCGDDLLDRGQQGEGDDRFVGRERCDDADAEFGGHGVGHTAQCRRLRPRHPY
jgi:hypothetical protein